MRRAILSPITSLFAALLSVATIAIAVRNGQSDELVGYSVGVSIGGMLFAVFALGTHLAFVTGDLETQRAARAVRVRVTTPAALATTILGAIGYSALSQVPLAPIIAGGLSAALISLAELESAYLNRHLRTGSVMSSEISSRVIGLMLVGAGVGFSWALLAVGASRFVALVITARSDPSRQGVMLLSVNRALKSSVRPSLMSSSLLYIASDRLLFLLFPLLAPPVVSAYLIAMMTSQQAVGAALASGLQTSLASRSQARELRAPTAAWHSRFESLIVLLSVILAVGGVALLSIPLTILGIPQNEMTSFMWAMVMVALPLATASRSAQYRLMGRLRRGSAVTSIGTGASMLALTLLIALIVESWRIAVLGPFLAEGCALIVGLWLLRKHDV